MTIWSKAGRLQLTAAIMAAILGCCALAGRPARAADAAASLGIGATFDTLQAGKTTYQHVEVRSISARNLMISHAGGLASVRLRDLSPELQAAFGYKPEAEAALNAAEADADQKRAKENSSKPAPASSRRPPGSTTFDSLMQQFGQPPEIRPSVDLRPKFAELALNVKNQGPRPSCAVFAIVSALEYQNAGLTGKAERFSEEYLVWATCKTLHRAARTVTAGGEAEADNSENLDGADEGFTLPEVVTALRAYGIPLQASMPYSFAKTMAAEPPAPVIDEARNHRRVSVFALPGRDQATHIANLIHSLNAGIPVAIGLQWPAWRTIRTGYLSGQKPTGASGHAVTVVGYENKTGAIADTVFIFKNSWGVKWGAGGYGYVTYGYLNLNLGDTALLEVAPAGTATAPR